MFCDGCLKHGERERKKVSTTAGIEPLTSDQLLQGDLKHHLRGSCISIRKSGFVSRNRIF